MNNLRKIAIALSAGLLAVSALTLIVLHDFDWNRTKPWFNSRASEALGRPFAILGDLSLTWQRQAASAADPNQGWRGMIPWPYLVAENIHIGNPSAMAASLPRDMAIIRQLSFSLNPLALLEKIIAIPELSFASPEVSLLRGGDDRNNWTFKNEDKGSPWQLKIQRVVLTKGKVHLLDAIRHVDVTADIDTEDADPAYGMVWQLRGRINGEKLSAHGKAGAVLSLQQQITPYPFMANLRMGQTVIVVEGTLTRPTELAALDMRLILSGVSMARLYALSGIVLPETPPFATNGHLTGTLSPQGSYWHYDKFSGMVGKSDIAGSLDYQAKQPRPMLTGTVVAHLLQLSDLAPLIGADSNASKAERGSAAIQPASKVLPVENFRTERWTSIDADIQFSAEQITRTKELPINKLSTRLQLQDGVLSLSPLDFTMSGGRLSSSITLDGSGKGGKDAIKAEMKATARHLQVQQLFPALQPLQASVGEINGDASLSATGNSIASLLGASNGEIRTFIDQGTVSKLLLEELGLNIGNVIVSHLIGDKQVKLNCLATDFAVSRGLMQTRSFIINTDAAVLDVNGNIDLAQERLDLTIKAKSKGLRVISLRAPIYVRGSFKAPSVSADKGVMALKAGGALALAVLAPVAALLPLINTGPQEDSACQRLLAEARRKTLAPPPGKTYRNK